MFPVEEPMSPQEEPEKPGWFPSTTQSIWSAVQEAADSDPEKAKAALERLTIRYRASIDGFFRRQRTVEYLRSFGCADDAEDLASEFILTHLFRRNIFSNFARRNVKFRSFLIQCLKGFVRDKRRGLEAEMRNSGRPPVSLDLPTEEGGPGEVGAMPEEVEHSVDLEFASAVCHQATQALGLEEGRKNNSDRFDALCGLIVCGDRGNSHKDIAVRLGTSEGNVKVMLHRLRARWAELFREEVAQTVQRDLLEDEMRYLIGLLAKQTTA